MIRSAPQPILVDKAATGVGSTINVEQFRTVLLQVGSTDSGAGTVKIKGSLSKTAPDFSATPTPTNHWDYFGSYDLDSLTFIAGATGLVMAGTDADNIRNLLINTDGLSHLTVDVTAFSAGKITVTAFGFGE